MTIDCFVDGSGSSPFVLCYNIGSNPIYSEVMTLAGVSLNYYQHMQQFGVGGLFTTSRATAANFPAILAVFDIIRE
jgi:hypothetical protein